MESGHNAPFWLPGVWHAKGEIIVCLDSHVEATFRNESKAVANIVVPEPTRIYFCHKVSSKVLAQILDRSA